MNLSSYVGQTVRIVFTTHGCCYSAHMGYAYLSAYCSYLTMQTAMCQGDTSATLTAPPGFSYLWHTVNGDTAVNGDTTSSIVVPNPTTGSTYTCVLTAVNGCSVTISQTLTYTVIAANFTHGSSCATLPIVFDDSSYVNQNEVTGWRWDFGDGSPVVTGNPTPTHSFADPGVYNVQLIAYSTEGCKDTIVKTISVDSLPTVTNTPLVKSICSKGNTDIDITASVTGTLVTWTASSKNGTTTGFSNSTAASSSIDQVLNNTGTIPDTITYHITPYKNTCSGPPVDYKVAVRPLPVLTNAIRLKSICDSTATNITLTTNNDSTQFTWSCTTSSANLSGYSNSATPGRIINQTIDNTGFTIDTVYYHIVGHSYGCSGDTSIYKVAVYPSPNLSNLPASKSICTNTSTNVNLTSNVVGTLFTWTATGSSANVSGYSNNATPTTLINQTLVNTDINLETVTYHLTPLANGCSGKVTNYTVTVNPLPLLTNIPPFTAICSNVLSNITLYSTVAGTQFTWTCTPSSGNVTGYSNNSTPTTTIAQTFQNSGNVLEIVTYHVTPEANGCPGTLQDYEVRVQPVPQLTNSPAVKSICEGENTAVTLTSNVSGALFTWTCTPGSASVSGYSNNATPASSISHVLTNSGTAPETVTYHLTPSANFCTGPVANFVVTVTPKPTLTVNPMNQEFCSGGNPNVSLTADCPGSTFAWTAQLISGTVSGFADGNGNTISQVLTNSGTTNGIVKYTITPSLGVCVGTSADYLVTVYPVPDLSTTPLSQTLCSSTPTNINLTSNVTGTLFTWTASGSSLQVAGYSNSAAPMSTINHLLVNSGYNIETVTYSITPHANGCDGSTYNFVSTVNPVPDITTSPAMYTICSGTSPNLSLTSNVTGTLFTWTAFATAGTLSGFSNNLTPTNILNQTLTNSGYTIEWVGYQITPSANGCNGAPLLYAITVNPTPDLSNLPLSQSQCNNQSTSLTLTSHVSGTQFTWIATGSSPQIAGYSNNVTTPDTEIDHILVNSGYNIETVTYHLLPEANGCDGTVTNYVVTVYPSPNVTFTPPTPSLCSAQTTNIVLSSGVTGTTYAWTASASSPTVSGYAAGTGNVIAQTLTTPGITIETVTYSVTPTANSCTGSAYPLTVTINPKPHLTNHPMRDTLCSEQSTNLLLTSSCFNTDFTWTASVNTGIVTGFSSGTGSLIAQPLINTLNTLGSVKYVIHPVAGSCMGDDTSYYFWVKPKPLLTNSPPSKSICNNQPTNVVLTSNVSGTTFTWTASGSTAQVTGFNNNSTPATVLNQTLVNSGSNIETVTYTITPRVNGCDGQPTNYTVTVYPSADAYYQPASQTICTGQTTGINILSHVAGTIFSYTATPSSPLLSGYSGGNGNNIAQTIFSTSTVVETVTYSVTPVANGCTGIPSSVIVTVNPGPALTTAPLAQTLCSNGNISVNLTSNVAGATFSWTATPSAGTLSGFVGGNGNLINQNLVNSGYTIENVTYSITPAANGCTGGSVNYVATVNPVPDLSNTPLASQLCSGSSPMINLTSNVAGTNFNWTATGSSPNIVGYGPGSGTLINQVLTNLGLSIENVTYHITPSANGCTGIMKDFVVTTVSTPDVYFSPTAQTICNAQTCNIQVLSQVSSATFTWTASASSGQVSGYSNGSGNLIAQTVFNSGNTIENVTYTATPTAFGCPPGIPQSVVLTVNPKPAVTNATRSSAICSAGTTNIALQSSVAGSTYGWTATGSTAQVSGFANGTGALIAQTLTNTGWNIETVTYIVTPSANSCSGDTSHFRVTVYPVADAYYTPPTQALCPGQTTNVVIASHVSGATFTWTATGSTAQVSGYASGSGNTVQQTLLNSGYSIETVTYHVTPVANGCTGTASNLLVSVNPNPMVTFTQCWDPTLTTTSKPISLKGATPLGGTFTGPGVTSGVFYPALAGTGTHTISYGSLNSYGCSASSTQTITVISPLAFSCGNGLVDVRDNKSYPTVDIGGQCWMAANLDYGTSVSGALTQRDNCVQEKFCYNDNAANCTTLGGLYQWDELMQYTAASSAQGLCPPDWHIPTEAEWNTLFNYFISNGFAGSALKVTGYSGFNAFLDGVRFKNVNWNFLDFATLFWSSTQKGALKAWAHGMNTYNPSVSFYPAGRYNAFSVRCMKD